MRLRLAIQRNRLPLVKTLFAIDATADPPPTISKLLEQVNELVPLEAETWGLEDYVVTIGAYECLHYSRVVDVIKEDDEICIRPISTPETRTRTLSGRYQINASGQHLTDGIPFGRPLIRAPTRPAVHIPPRKRRKLALGLDVFRLDEESDEEPKLLENEVAGGDDEDENTEEEDEDFVPGDEDDDIEESNEELEDNEDSSTAYVQADSGSVHLGSKRKRSVSFSKVVDVEKDSHSILTGSSSSEAEDSEDSEDSNDSEESEESENDSDSESDGSSSENETSEDEGAEPDSRSIEPADDSSDSDTTSEDTSDNDDDDDDDSASSAEKQLQADSQRKLQTQATADSTQLPRIDKTPMPPGEGKRETQKRNIRRRQKKRLDNLIKTGKLPPNATMNDLEAYLPEPATDQCSNSLHNHASGMEELEVQRQRLLEQLQNGGIDIANVVSKRPKESSKAPARSPLGVDRSSAKSATTSSTLKDQSTIEDGGLEEEPSPGSVESKRPRLNLAGSNRLIFGSLGVRAPKSKDDGEKVRQKLAARGELHRADASVSTEPTADTLEDANATKDPNTDVLSDGWQNKIILKAVECVDEGVVLSQPPYPFVQCWDEQYVWNRPQNNRKKRRKNRGHAMNIQEDDEQYTEGWTEDMYGDETSAKPESMTRRLFNHEGYEETMVENAGFPSMPTDIQALPALAAQYCNPDTYIVFKEMHVDASTKWQPEISDWQLARVDQNMGVDGLNVTLAPGHRTVEQARYDDAGRRIREGFEMPDSDDGDEEGTERIDNGVREITLESLMEVRLLEAPDAMARNESESEEVHGDEIFPSFDNKSLDAPQTNDGGDVDPGLV